MEKEKAEEPIAPYHKPVGFEQVWQMFQETDKKFQETDKKIKELAALFTTQWGKLVEQIIAKQSFQFSM
jgi:hypothetical protein